MTLDDHIINETLRTPGWLNDREIQIKIHPAKSDIIVINYPGYKSDIDGYNNKYGKIADFIVEKGIGAVVRMGNQDLTDFPEKMIENFKRLVQYSIRNSKDICENPLPKIYLMGHSAGASTVAAVCSDFPEVEKILLMAPSSDAGEAMTEGLEKFTGEVYIVVGENDKYIYPKAREAVYKMAKAAKSRQMVIIPNCDHVFGGELNGMIMSKAPLWAFAGDATFPSPEGGRKLYD